jgi:uncharacterized protein
MAESVRSAVSGAALSIPFVSLLALNGAVFGVSGFLHRAVRGNKDGLIAFSGVLLGGSVAGVLTGHGPRLTHISFPTLLCSGFLVGLGTKV